MSLAPTGEQKDIIVNSSDNVIAVNPLYISGVTDNWLTELIYDRLYRVGPDGLPTPWAAESHEWRDETTIAVKLRDGLTFHDGKPIGIALPPQVVLEVTWAEMAVKGNTATNVKKDATVETGMQVKVPMHVKEGDQIKLSTDSGEFMGRASE